jgi:uncharacterized protein YndB with AHSA1/START domain
MTMQTVDAVEREVSVRVAQERAFVVFVAEMTSWWPAEHHIGDAPIEQIIIEPHDGGRWYTRHQDGSETTTGHVGVWDPPERLVLIWQLAADWTFDPTLITTLELRFLADGPDRTRVRLTHGDLQNYGPEAPRMRQMFDAPDAWEGALSLYAAAATA